MPRCPPEDERGAEEPPLVESRGARLGPPRQGGVSLRLPPRAPRRALARSSTRMFPPGPETPETPSPPHRGDRSPDLAAGARAFASGPRAGPPGLLTHDGPWREQRTQRLPALRTLPT